MDVVQLLPFLVLMLSERTVTENNTVCSSINSPSNLVNNVFASVHYLGFNIKLLFFFT